MSFLSKNRQKVSVFVPFGVVFTLIWTPFYAFSAENSNKNDLKQLEIAIESGKVKENSLKRTAAEINAERQILNKQIKIAAKQIQQSEAHLSSSEKKLKTLSVEENLLNQKYVKRKKILATLLSALLRLEKNPPPALLTKPDDASNALRSAIILGKIVPEVKKQSDIIGHDLANLKQIRMELTSQQNELIRNTQALRKQRNVIANLLEQKLTLSSKTQAEIKAEQQKMASLGQKAKNIRDLYRKLEQQKKIERALADKQALAREAERLREIAAQKKLLELAKKEQNNQSVKRIETNLTQLKKPPSRQKHALVSFANLKRKLPYPAQGHLLKKFGEKDTQGRRTKGLTISTRPFAQITSPATGTILFADYFSNYGHLVIIDVGNNYSILLTGLGKIAVLPKQFVEVGDPIGIMPKTAINLAQNNANSPILYVEFRRSDKSIDSAAWWRAKLSRK